MIEPRISRSWSHHPTDFKTYPEIGDPNFKCTFYAKNKLNWTDDPVLILRIYITADYSQLLSRNLDPLLEKAEATTTLWSRRNLSLFGKILIINSLVTSLFTYWLTVLPTPSDQFFKEYNKIVRQFLWDGGKAKVKMDILYSHKLQGGTSLVDLVRCEQALKLQMVGKLKQNQKLQDVANTLVSSSIGSDIWMLNLTNKDYKRYEGQLNRNCFWKSVLDTWIKIKSDTPIGKNEILGHSLWYNSYVRINRNYVYFSNWYSHGIKLISDIWNSEASRFAHLSELQEKFTIKIPFTQYHGITKAIIPQWIEWLHDGSNNQHIENLWPMPAKIKIFANCITNLFVMKQQLLTRTRNG